ncbi:DUF732 domain-containing protein [Mycobacterium sp. SM1]|uniref:DUF732 domain-containing protein n=1 Tax=Mycobacterium sp. SM1 TaxID=2816243 RepID=UPI001BD18698|nr:DUF732 domain-containing protein [Mycobacterium sp. SM1]MBS4728953.1 DUF732 domain-containing protein [Mycobacterium sp. SM1]
MPAKRAARKPMIIPTLAVSLGVAAAAGAAATPAQANSIDDGFLSALTGAGINYGDPGSAVALGQSICPMLAQPGGTFASAVSSITGSSGMSPAMADMFTSIAISMYCPSMMASIANGNLPSLPQLPGVPSI